MLKTGLFDDFKGAATLLIWGDEEGMTVLLAGLTAVRDGKRKDLTIDGVELPLTVCRSSGGEEPSSFREDENGFRWQCSHETVALAADLVEPLATTGAGHQFLEVNGLAEQVIICQRRVSSRPVLMSAMGGKRTLAIGPPPLTSCGGVRSLLY